MFFPFYLFLLANVSLGDAVEVNYQNITFIIYCICTEICFTYFIMAYFSLLENLTVGHSCLYNMQCTRTKFANVCRNQQCECQSGYIFDDSNCYLGN